MEEDANAMVTPHIALKAMSKKGFSIPPCFAYANITLLDLIARPAWTIAGIANGTEPLLETPTSASHVSATDGHLGVVSMSTIIPKLEEVANVWNAMATETDSTVKDANPIIFSHPFKMNKAGYLVSRATVMLLARNNYNVLPMENANVSQV